MSNTRITGAIALVLFMFDGARHQLE
jgi:hypothetical protein